jgi:hypothetical protein
MASELRVNTLKDASGNNSVATSVVFNGSSKAWLRFNGTGTVAINDSYNVASLTDDGTGDYHYNFTNAMSNAAYSQLGLSGTGVCTDDTVTASLANIGTFNTSGSATDSSRVCAGIDGDLA